MEGLAASMEPAPALSLPPQLLRLKQAPANPLGRVSAKIHTTHHSGATVKACLIGLINKTAFLLQTLTEEERERERQCWLEFSPLGQCFAQGKVKDGGVVELGILHIGYSHVFCYCISI